MTSRIIHCRYCGADNAVAYDVVGKFCDQCNSPIYSPEAEGESEAPKAIADRTGEVLRIVCPRCGFRNELPHMDMAFIVRCRECWEAIAVEELRQ
jgi:hypothetical protein